MIFLGIVAAIGLMVAAYIFLRGEKEQHVELPKIGPEFLDARYEPWADSVLTTMTEKEKVSQLVMLETEGLMENLDPLAQEFSERPYGGIFYSGTNLVSHVSIYNALQENIKVPPFFAVQAPFGLFQIPDSNLAPPQYATLMNFESDSVLEDMARYVAGQCRALRIHINFSSFFDVIEQNSDPAFDPGYRKFAGDLTRRSLIYSRAMADSGVIACFGSFLNLGPEKNERPRLTPLALYEKRWDTLRIRPYRMLADSGVLSFKTDHYPQFRSEQERNELFLQRPVIKDSLVRHTAFGGLVLGDIRDRRLGEISPVREAALASLLTGTDMLVVRDSAEQIVQYLQSQVGRNGFTKEVLNRKVKKILMAKAWLGIPKRETIDIASLARHFDRNRDFAYSEKLYGSVMVVLQDRKKMIPLNNLEKREITILSLAQRKQITFAENINYYFPVPSYLVEQGKDPAWYEKFAADLQRYNTLIVGVDAQYFRPQDTVFMNWLRRLNKTKDMALVIFGDHDVVDDVYDFPTIVLAYGRNRMAERVAAQLVMGGIGSSGRLPVSCTDRFCYSDGLQRKKVRVQYTVPEAVGLSSGQLARIDTIAELSIRQQTTPGCQVVVIKDGCVIFRRSYGYHTYTKEKPVLGTDIYDLASVTKVAATTIGVMRLYDEGKIKLDTTLSAYLPGLEKSELRTVKIRDVLLHRAGFPAVPPIFRYIRAVQKFRNNKGRISPVTITAAVYDTLFGKADVKEADTLYRYAYAPEQNKEYTLPVGEGIYMRSDMPDSIYQLVTKTKLVYPVAYKYSDMSMYIMMQVVQRITGKTLDEYMAASFYRPMGLVTMGYNPLQRFPKERIVPTEKDDIYRKQLIHGYVHDPTASVLGGVGGHAGLFSDAMDLAVLMQMVLNGGSYGGRQYFSSQTVQLFTSPQPESYRGLGWDHQYASHNPMIADSASVYTYGHTGFTGTCVWVDPKYKLVYVFLSNRVHPTAENKKLQTSAVRQRIHQVIYDAME